MTLSRLSTSSLYNRYTKIGPTGGSIATYSDYTYHTFTASGTFTIPQTINLTSVDAFIVGAGGGCSGPAIGAGGGGIVLWTAVSVAAGNSYTVTVGAGVSNADGTDSTFGGLTATGGKRGIAYDDTSGNSGIPSSLGATTPQPGGNQTGQGNGGGAGYSAAGGNAPASYYGGVGGEGYTLDTRLAEVLGLISTKVICSGGGGGTDTRGGAITFGDAGTGAGRGNTSACKPGVSFGSGAGGGGWTASAAAGANGVVVIRYTTLQGLIL